MGKYLDQTGLSHFWGKIKAKLAKKADQTTVDTLNQDVQGLQSDLNDLGADVGANYAKKTDVANTYATKTTVNGLSQDIADLETGLSGKVNQGVFDIIAEQVDTNKTDIANLKTSISTVYRVKGSTTYEDLPKTNMQIGDVYNISESFTYDSVEYPAGTNVVYTDDGWDILSGVYDLSTYAKSTEVEALSKDIDDITSDLAGKVDTTSFNDLADNVTNNYAKKTDIETNYVKKADAMSNDEIDTACNNYE